MIKVYDCRDDRDIRIIPERDHYELYVNGSFFCSADTVSEAVHEYEEWCSREDEEI